MKIKYYRFSILALLLILVQLAKGQSLSSKIFKKDHNVFMLSGGVSFTNIAPLSQLIYGNTAAVNQPVAFRTNFTYGLYLNEHSIFIYSISNSRSVPKLVVNDYLELEAVSVLLGYGYHIKPTKRWSFLPQLGLGVVQHSIFFDRGAGSKINVINQFALSGTASRFIQSRYLAEAKLNILYKIPSDFRAMHMNYLGVQFGFSQSLGSARWFQRNNDRIAGPTLFPQIFSAQLSFIWKI